MDRHTSSGTFGSHLILYEKLLMTHSPETIAQDALEYLRPLISYQRAGVISFLPESDQVVLLAKQINGQISLNGHSYYVPDLDGLIQRLLATDPASPQQVATLLAPVLTLCLELSDADAATIAIPLMVRGALIGL